MTATPPPTSTRSNGRRASRSTAPPSPSSGATRASPSSTRPATSISPPRSSAPCASSTAAVGVFCAVGGVEVQSRDGLVPGQQAQRAAHRLRQQARPHGRRLLRLHRADEGEARRRPGHLRHAGRPVRRVRGRHRPDRDEVHPARPDRQDEHVKYSLVDIPAAYKEQAEEYHRHLLEAASHADDHLLELILEGKPVSEGAAAEGAAHGHAGRQADADPLRLVEDLPRRAAAARRRRRLPAVAGRPAAGRGHRAQEQGEGDASSASPTRRSRSPAWRSRPSPSRPATWCYVRIYSGELHPKDEVLNTTIGRSERIARIFRMMGDRRDRWTWPGRARSWPWSA